MKDEKPFRQARSKDDLEREAREAEWALWERQQRRVLVKEYLKAAVQIAAFLAVVVVVALIVVGAIK